MSHLSGFLHAIRDDPTDLGARLIFADWLEEQSDPSISVRGEFVRLQCRLAAWVPDLAERTELQVRQTQLLEAHRDDWLGPLAQHCSAVQFERGLSRVTLTARRFGAPRFAGQAGELFERAWVEGVRLEGEGQQLARTAASPALAEVVNLDLSGNALDDTAVIELLSSPHLRPLRRLELANNHLTDSTMKWLVGSPLADQLTGLGLRSNRLSGEAVELLFRSPLGQRLRQLELQGNDLDDSALDAWDRWKLERPDTRNKDTFRLFNSIGMELALIPAGSFLMGAPESEAGSDDDEKPQHLVTISRPFFLGIYPVMQQEYERVMNTNPSHFNSRRSGGPAHPVENVSWLEANEFCRRLSALPAEKRQGRIYRLPTEAEWEYAARAGSPPELTFPFGNALSSRQANFNGLYPYGDAPRGPYLQRTTRVGSYPANPFGLYDLHGNVWEWCSDWYDAHYYRHGPAIDPAGPDSGERRVLRGGSWLNQGVNCRTAARDRFSADFRYNDNGFRVVLMVPA